MNALPIPAPPPSRDSHAADFKRQSSLSYKKVLEREVLTCRWRERFYPRRKDRDFHGKVAELKKLVILQIAAKLEVPCIFSDPAYRGEVETSMGLNAPGFPTLHYKDFSDREAFLGLDQRAYFRPGTDVRLCYEGRVRTARILTTLLPGLIVRVRIDHGPTIITEPLKQPELAITRL